MTILQAARTATHSKGLPSQGFQHLLAHEDVEAFEEALSMFQKMDSRWYISIETEEKTREWLQDNHEGVQKVLRTTLDLETPGATPPASAQLVFTVWSKTAHKRKERVLC
jgi:hypothetical protein